MTSTINRTIVLLFVGCALQVQTMAWSELTGKLRTLNNKSVSVNNRKVKTGATILSGSDILCPDKIGATVDLGELGRIDMAPKTDLRLGFDAYGVTIHLRTGYVVLTTNKGITGAVTTSEGKILRTDSSKVSSVAARTKDAVDQEPVGAGPDDSDNPPPATARQ
jgi:hypothetical protein